MFFHINEDVLRQLAEKAKAQSETAADESEQAIPGIKLWMDGRDGAIVIDDPALLISVSYSTEPISDEEIDKVSYWNPDYGWRPIRERYPWLNKNVETTTNQTTSEEL